MGGPHATTRRLTRVAADADRLGLVAEARCRPAATGTGRRRGAPLRRAFVGRLGVSPRAYQQRFRSARRHDAG